MSAAPPKPTLFESISHKVQVCTMTKKKGLRRLFTPISLLLKPVSKVLSIYEGVKANQALYLHRKLILFGDNFVCAGGVWMSSFDEVEKMLLEPQARSFQLARNDLDPQHLPDMNLNKGGRLTFLLALSQRGAGGDGMHEAFRSAFEDYLTHSKETKARLKDDVTKGLVEDLKKEFKAKGGLTDEFLDDNDGGLLDYLLKYLHYVLFGIDPKDEEKIEVINGLHYDSTSAPYYLNLLGNVLQGIKYKDWTDQMRAVVKIYEESPALKDFKTQSKYNNMTRAELANLALSIMSLAGMVGPKTLAYNILGKSGLPAYEGENTGDINVIDKLKELDMTDRDELLKYIHECGRLWNPVGNSHKVAQEDFTIPINGKERTFPAGTIIYIPMQLGSLDERFWGETVYEFDHERSNLCPFSMIFHSVGEKTNGRICPGKEVAETMLVDALVAIGSELKQGAS